MLVMPPNEPCPHCGQLIRDWHNEWYEGAQRRAIYSGHAAMDCPLCRQPVLWFESRHLAAPAGNAQVQVYQRSAILAAQWVPIREATCGNLAGYISNHPAGQQYGGYWQASEIQQADQQVAKP
jgi:hypothetical protein